MKLTIIALILINLIAFSVSAQKVSHKLIVAGSGTKCIAIIDNNQTTTWKHQIKLECNSVSMLEDGTILYSDKKEAFLIDTAHNILWQYKGDENGEVQSATMLPNGNFLIMQNGTPARLLEINRKGKIKLEIEIPTVTPKPHGQFRNITKTKDKTYLIPYFRGDKVCEYNKKGDLLRTIEVKGNNFHAKRLENGNTMIACGDAHRLIEVDSEDNIVWELNENDLKNTPLFFVAGFDILPNGNILIANWGGHGHIGEQAQLIEVTKNKKVVWSYENWKEFKGISSFQVLD